MTNTLSYYGTELITAFVSMLQHCFPFVTGAKYKLGCFMDVFVQYIESNTVFKRGEYEDFAT